MQSNKSLISDRGWARIVRGLPTIMIVILCMCYLFFFPLEIDPIAYAVYESTPEECSSSKLLNQIIVCNTDPENFNINRVSLFIALASRWENKHILWGMTVFNILLFVFAPWVSFPFIRQNRRYVLNTIFIFLLLITVWLFYELVNALRNTKSEMWLDKPSADSYVFFAIALPCLTIHLLAIIWSSDWFLRYYLPGIFWGRWPLSSEIAEKLNEPKDVLLVKSTREKSKYILYVLDKEQKEQKASWSLKSFTLDNLYRYTSDHKAINLKLAINDKIFHKILPDVDSHYVRFLTKTTMTNNTKRYVVSKVDSSKPDADPIISKPFLCKKIDRIINIYCDHKQKEIYVLCRRNNQKIFVHHYKWSDQNKNDDCWLDNTYHIPSDECHYFDLRTPHSASLVALASEKLIFRTKKYILPYKISKLNNQLKIDGDENEIKQLTYPYEEEMKNVTGNGQCTTCVKHIDDDKIEFHIYDDENDLSVTPDAKVYWGKKIKREVSSAFTFSKKLDRLVVIEKNKKSGTQVWIVATLRLGRWLPIRNFIWRLSDISYGG